MTVEELQNIVKENGIVGAGGAGFPSYMKIDNRAEVIVLNCAECEPLLKLHRQLLQMEAGVILNTLHKIASIVGAKVVIGIKYEYEAAIKALEIEIGDYPDISIHPLKSAYPMGDEVELIYETTGKLVKPGKLPIEEKVVVFNVETVYNIYQALELQKPVSDKLLTIAGEVHNPISYRLPLGCTVKEAVAMAGGVKVLNPVYLMGGPMMGRLVEETDVITKTTNAIIVLPENHSLVTSKRKNIRNEVKRAVSACCQCQTCTDLCPRHELGYPIEPHKFMRSLAYRDTKDADVFKNLFFCSQCGLCEMYSCPQGLSPRSLINECRNGLRKAGMKPEPNVIPSPILESRAYKYVPENRLIARLGLTCYDVEAPLSEMVHPVKKVKIPLSQHIGAPSVCCVHKGDYVEKGQIIANAAEGLSVALHASITGEVREITPRFIIIEAKER